MVFSLALSMPSPSLPTAVFDPRYALDSALTTASRDLPDCAEMSIAVRIIFCDLLTDFVATTNLPNAGRNLSSTMLYCDSSALIVFSESLSSPLRALALFLIVRANSTCDFWSSSAAVIADLPNNSAAAPIAAKDVATAVPRTLTPFLKRCRFFSALLRDLPKPLVSALRPT